MIQDIIPITQEYILLAALITASIVIGVIILSGRK